MQDCLSLIRTRRSCRAYLPKMPPDEILAKIAEAGTWAASGRGRQPTLIVMVKDKATRDLLSEMNRKILGANSDPFYGAPVVAVILADKTAPTYIYDGSIVIANMMLEAHDLGLGSCWIHRAKEEFSSPEGLALLQKWGIKGDYEGIGHCILGYAADAPRAAAARKPDFVHWI